MASDSSKTTKRLYQFKDARRMARQYGFASREEFIEYECAGKVVRHKQHVLIFSCS